MKFLAVVIPPPAIYHGCSTRKTFREEKFAPGEHDKLWRHNVRNTQGDQEWWRNTLSWTSILSLICLDKREVISSEPKDYTGIPVKGDDYISDSQDPKFQTRNKRQIFPLLTLLIMISGSCFKKFKNPPYLDLQK